MLNKLTLKKSKSEQSNQGFTIIEVMIVLAIAGLIMLIVFLAVPSLQRNGRNTQRKSDVASLLGSITEYTSNNNGGLPTNQATATAAWKPGFYTAASVTFLAGNNTAIGSPNVDTIYLNTGAKCSGGNFGGAGATARNVAVVYTIETQAGTQSVCQET